MIQCPKCGIGQTVSSQYCSICGTIINQKSSLPSMTLSGWEKRDGSLFGTFFKTIGTLLSSPSTIFRQISSRSKVSSAILFYVLILLIVTPILTWVQSADISSGGGQSEQFLFIKVILQPVFTLILGLISLVISASLLHLLFIITRVKTADFKETLIAYCYIQAPVIFFLIPLPILPQLFIGIWSFVLQVIGMAEVHKTSYGKMFLIQFVTAMILFVILFFLTIILLLILAAAGLAVSDTLNIQDILDLVR